MYHSISEEDESRSPYYVTNTCPTAFRNQMRFLAENNYRVVDLETALSSKIGNENSVVITFDDGFRDFYTTAFPVLREFGFTATMFVPTGFITGSDKRETGHFPRPSDGRGIEGEGSNSETRCSFNGRACMTWDEVRTLADEGIRFGSHTVTHPKLHGLEWAKIEAELAESKGRLEQMLGGKVTAFAYPFAYPQADPPFVEKFETLLKQVGYRCNATTRIGRADQQDDPFSLRRLPMNSFDDDLLLEAKLSGGYDWLAGPQALTKQVKRWVSLS